MYFKDSDKIILLFAGLLLLAVCIFRQNLLEEIRLMNEITEQNIHPFFYPLSPKEKIVALRAHIEKIGKIQERIKNSFLLNI